MLENPQFRYSLMRHLGVSPQRELHLGVVLVLTKLHQNDETKHLSNVEWETRDKYLSPSLPRRIGCLQVLNCPQKTKMKVVNPESRIILN